MFSGNERAVYLKRIKRKEKRAFNAEGNACEALGEIKHTVKVVSGPYIGIIWMVLLEINGRLF